MQLRSSFHTEAHSWEGLFCGKGEEGLSLEKESTLPGLELRDHSPKHTPLISPVGFGTDVDVIVPMAAERIQPC